MVGCRTIWLAISSRWSDTGKKALRICIWIHAASAHPRAALCTWACHIHTNCEPLRPKRGKTSIPCNPASLGTTEGYRSTPHPTSFSKNHQKNPNFSLFCLFEKYVRFYELRSKADFLLLGNSKLLKIEEKLAEIIAVCILPILRSECVDASPYHRVLLSILLIVSSIFGYLVLYFFGTMLPWLICN